MSYERKVCGIFLFSFFFFFALYLEMKIKNTWFLYVTSNERFLEFSTAQATEQKKERRLNKVVFLNCDLRESENRDSYKK